MFICLPLRNGAYLRSTGAYAPGKEQYMNNTDQTTNAPAKAQETAQPDLVKRIGNTTYEVKIHFSETSKETLTDKVLRLIRNEVVSNG
jgi:hypothetical protein